MQRDFEALAARQRNLITRRQLEALGLSRSAIRHQLASGRLHIELGDVYRLPGARRDWRTRLHAAVLAAGEGAVVSHRAAAALMHVPGFPERAIELTVPYRRSVVLSGAIVHRSRCLPVGHTKLVDGLPTTSMARTLCDLAAIMHPAQTARALDNSIARGGVTTNAMWRVLNELHPSGRRGSGAVRRLLRARGEGYVAPASDLEARFAQIICEGGLPSPDRQVDVGDGRQWVGRVDFAYRDAKLLIEVDSRLHHTSLLDLETDRTRDNRLMASGWRLLRITWQMLAEQPDEVVSTVATALGVAAA
jgi:very-short-patch-repair endonuclease